MLKSGRYDHIVVDTAPFGHTLRLFELPAHFQRFLDFLNVASSRDTVLAETFGGHAARPSHAFLDRWQTTVSQLREAFSARQAEICLVTTPELFSLNEAARSLDALSESVPEMKVGRVVLNRIVTQPGSCAHCRARAGMAREAIKFIKHHITHVPLLLGPDPGNPILGIPLLKNFGDVVFAGKRAKLEKKPPAAAKLRFKKTEWPAVSAPLSFTVGKGGVGKTTTTAALAFHTRASRKVPVTVCSTDPAPSLDDIFQKAIGDARVSVLKDAKFSAMELDSVAEYRKYAGRIRQRLNSELSRQSGGLHVDLTFEKEVFSALIDVVPPGVDEIFAIFRILDLVEECRHVFIDMAPTGHALELLRMPERVLLWSRLLLKSLAAHRTLALAQDVAVELATLGQQVRRLIAIIKDPARSRVFTVMLAEPVPDQQTERLVNGAEELGINVDSLFVNRVLMESSKCRRCARSQQWQRATLGKLGKKYPRYPIYMLREFPR